MSWIDDIFSWVWDISLWFYDAYLEVKGWVWPFYNLASPLLFLSGGFFHLLTPIAHFYDWAYDIGQKITNILSSFDIMALLRTWLDWAEWSWEWITNAWPTVTSWIDSWWSVTSWTVQTWIDTATEGLVALKDAWTNFWTITWPEWTGNLSDLRAGWDNFWIVTFPELVNFDWLTSWWSDRLLDLQSLINTAFLDRDSWWAGWQDWRDQVIEFFTDPLEFLLDRFTDWVLGPEE